MSDASNAIAAGYPQGHPLAEAPKPRVWPAVVIVVLQWAALILPSKLAPGDFISFYGFMIGIYGGTAAILLWWLFVSRVRWLDVGLGLLAIGVCLAAAAWFGDQTLREMGGFPVIAYVLPAVTTAMVVSLALTPFLGWPWRRALMLLAMIGISGYFLTRRLDGMDGSFQADWQSRFATSKDLNVKIGTLPKETVSVTAADWPEFRGPSRDGVLRGVVIDTDWKANPPKLLWKQNIGKGWSSFAAVGDRLFTQEQRGPDEVVVCYDAGTGEQLWAHADKTEFKELIGGAGPRATPTFHQGKIYAQGATGILNCLDAQTGAVVWSRDIRKTYDLKVPMWGFSASPLVHAGIVTVHGGKVDETPEGKKDKAILAFDAATGEPKWTAGTGDHSYCSTQLSKIDGVEQILISTNEGVTSVDPVSGKVLWAHDWPIDFNRVVQPAVVGSDVLIGTSFNKGTRRVHVDRKGADWSTAEVWTSRDFKPYFSDFVIRGDNAYGFDGPIFACVDLKTGKRKWSERGYGSGQVLLLADQGVLLILSETGEVSLVEATPAEHKQLAQIAGVEGKTWNHPTVVRDKLFIRNGQEAACFQLKAKQ